MLESVLADARRIHAGYADDEVGDGLASVWYAATAIVELGAALELDEADVRVMPGEEPTASVALAARLIARLDGLA